MAQYDIRIEGDEQNPCVTVMGEKLLTVLPGDVEPPGTAQGLAERTAAELRAAMFGDALGRALKTHE